MASAYKLRQLAASFRFD